MKKSTIIFLLFIITSQVFAQNPASHLKGGEDEASKQAIANFRSTPVVQGFKICLYTSSDQDARSKAKETLELCYSSFPDIDGEIVYQAPIFKVIVGACIDKVEATRLLARLKVTFPKAFVISSAISVSDFLKKEIVTDTMDTE